MSTAPADGERRAAGGLFGQYRASAALILERLHRLDSIRVADPNAGRVDDCQILMPTHLDAFQIKWSQYPRPFTFNDLIRSSKDKPCLMRQLADGWQRLRATTPGRRTVVHLVTNDLPSTNDKPPFEKPLFEDVDSGPIHFAAFLKKVWEPACGRNADIKPHIPNQWKPAWDKLIKASELDQVNFDEFVHDCRLVFNFRPEYFGQNIVHDQPDGHDLRHMADTLFSVVADPNRIIELNRKDLLKKLSWSDRFEYRSRHEFPAPEIPYQPLEHSVNQLKQALTNLPGGYIGLFGTPGSGKSTLLSKTLRELSFRLVRYYAYVPDDRASRKLRGESSNFLHDVGLQLSEAGFSASQEAPSSHEQLLDQFHQQLQLLHDDWVNNGLKTIILIDGLDHIPREQKPGRSLIHDLPDPEQIPEGVFIILGSQTDQPLSSRIRHIVANPERRIDTQPLSRAATVSIIMDSEIPYALTEENTQLIYERCDGHPLALVYIIQQLRTLDSDCLASDVLKGIRRFDETIETQYESYWDEIADQTSLRELFGLLSRMRGAINLHWVRTWANGDAVDALKRTAPHYFKREADKWYFFHNSFREFLRHRTQEVEPGNPSQDVDRQLYGKLAGHCVSTTTDSPNSWDALYYRNLARDYNEVVQLATAKNFRDQFLAFRPLVAIREDINIALQAAAETKDPSSLIRILFAGAEFQQRGRHLEENPLGSLLLEHGKHDQATAHICDGNHLQVSECSAMDYSRNLYLKHGAMEQSRRVFYLAEPLKYLSGATALDRWSIRSDEDDLYKWAKVAPFFLDVDEILETIDRVQVEAISHWDMSAEDATHYVQCRMRAHLGYGVVDKQDWDAIDKVIDGFNLRDKIDLENWCWFVVRVLVDPTIKDQLSKKKKYIEQIIDLVDPEMCDTEGRVLIAECIFLILGDKRETKRWLAGLDQPELPKDVSSQSGFEPFKLRFRLNRLLYGLGSDSSVVSLVPNQNDPNLEPIVLFERAVCKISLIWGRIWRDNVMPDVEIKSVATSLLRFLNRDSIRRDYRMLDREIRGLRKDLFTLLIRAVARHGSNAIAVLRDTFEREWDSPDTRDYWPPELIRALTLALHNHDVGVCWAAQRLREIEPEMLYDTDASGRVGQYRVQADAWRQLDCEEEADRCLNGMLQATSGIGYRKDYQLDSWIRWLARINVDEPDNAADRISWFASTIQAMNERVESGAVASASLELLRVTFQWSPCSAVKLFSWLTKKGLVSYVDGLNNLLQYVLKANSPPTQIVLHLFNHLFLTFSSRDSSDIAALIINNTFTQTGQYATSEAATSMIESIERYGLPTARVYIRHEIAESLQKLGVLTNTCNLSDFDAITPEIDLPYSSKLQLENDELSIEDVIARVSGMADLETLLQLEDRKSHFNWMPVINKFAVNLSCKELEHLVELFSSRYRSVEILCTIAKILHEKGEINLAWNVGLQALDNSKSYGWDIYVSEGSRVTAFETLLSIKPAASRDLAFKKLVQDVVEDEINATSIVVNLERIIPVIADDVSLCDTWAAVENHVHALFADVQSDPELAAMIAVPREDDSAEAAAVDLIALHLDHPTSEVAQAAQRTLAACLEDSVGAVDRIVVESLKGGEPRQEAILIVLDALHLKNTACLSRFSNNLQSMVASPSYFVRQAAKTICTRIGVNLSASTSKESELAPVYELVLPTQNSLYRSSVEAFDLYKPSPDTNKPHELVQPFDQNLKSIAKLAGLNPVNLYYRASQIMEELEPVEFWNADAEAIQRSMMDSTGLSFSFRRPKFIVARRAMHHVISELADAGKLSKEKLACIDIDTRSYDPRTVLLVPALRPVAIPSISVPDEYQIDTDKWVGSVADAFDTFSNKHIEGHTIIAEQTLLKRLDSYNLTELRYSLIGDGSAMTEEIGDGGDGFFYRVSQCMINEYASLGSFESSIPILIQHFGIGYDSPAVSWLALNPAIGELLGWTSSAKGLFTWVDDNNNVMVESLWWIDGVLAQNQGTNSKDEVGEGWLVMASRDGLKQLRDKFSTIIRRQHVERNYTAGNREVQMNKSTRKIAMEVID